MASQEEIYKLHKNLNRFVQRYISQYCIICFGNNDITAETIKFLNKNKIPVKTIFDNAGEGKSKDGITIMRPQNYKYSNKTVVLIGSKYYNEMKQQLLELGYKDKQIIQTMIYADMYVPKTTLKEFFNQAKKTVIGGKIYKKVSQGMRNKGILFISPAKSIGDIYLMLMYTKAYTEAYGITDFRYVITGGAAEALCRACGVSDYVKINMDEMFLLRKFVRFMDMPDRRVTVCNEIWSYTNLGVNTIGYGKYDNFSMCYKKSVLALKGDNIKPQCPLKKVSKGIDKIFRENNLIEGKTVLLAPHTNYLKPLPARMWTELADSLQKEGFAVCTNCGSADEPPIQGTIPISLRFEEICDFIETAGYFIGVRSGLCDVISSCKAKIFVVYPKCMQSRFISADLYFGLRRMQLTDSEDIKEYVWNPEEPAEMVSDRILADVLCKGQADI